MRDAGTPAAGPDGPSASLDLHDTGPRALGEIRRWLRARLARLSRADLDDVIQVADELASNAYEHAGGACAIRLTHHRARCSVTVEVEDDDPATPTLGRSRHGPAACRGRGTVLVDQISRCWGVRRPAFGHNTKTVWAEIATADS
jgi:anti-sigma regulatory factor (Ser/Thr protein kinase)